jgi:hypothetical protein
MIGEKCAHMVLEDALAGCSAVCAGTAMPK